MIKQDKEIELKMEFNDFFRPKLDLPFQDDGSYCSVLWKRAADWISC